MDDLISRQAAIEAVRIFYADECALVDSIEEQLEKLPSAQPQRIKGRWISFDIPWYQCSECGAVRENNAFMENFCPNCGADMRGEEDAVD